MLWHKTHQDSGSSLGQAPPPPPPCPAGARTTDSLHPRALVAWLAQPHCSHLAPSPQLHHPARSPAPGKNTIPVVSTWLLLSPLSLPTLHP